MRHGEGGELGLRLWRRGEGMGVGGLGLGRWGEEVDYARVVVYRCGVEVCLAAVLAVVFCEGG